MMRGEKDGARRLRGSCHFFTSTRDDRSIENTQLLSLIQWIRNAGISTKDRAVIGRVVVPGRCSRTRTHFNLCTGAGGVHSATAGSPGNGFRGGIAKSRVR